MLRRPGGGIKISIAAGSDFDLTSSGSIFIYPMSPMRIQKWGSGTDPILRRTSSGTIFQIIGDNDCAVNDLVVDRIQLLVHSSGIDCSVTEFTTEFPARRCGLHLLDVTVTGVYLGHRVSLSAVGIQNCGMVGGTISGGADLYPGKVSNGRESNLQMTHWAYGAVVGTSISGGGCPSGSTGLTYAHHIYWSPLSNCILSRWINFGPTTPYATPDVNGYTHAELNFCIKGSVTGYVGEFPRLCRGWLVDQCQITGTGNPGAFGRQNSTNVVGNGFDRVIVSRCRVYKSALVGGQNVPFYMPALESGTFRDNTVWNCGGLQIAPEEEAFRSDAKLYRNRIAVVPARAPGITIGNVRSLELTDNIVEFQGASGTSKRSAVMVTSWDYLSGLSNCVIDRNQYFYPDQVDTAVFRDNTPSSTMKTLTLWRARGWDTNVILGDPGWPDPANGDFGDGIVPADPVVFSVSVTPSTAILNGGDTGSFTALILGLNSPSQGVTWSTTVGSITSLGVFTAPASTAVVQTVILTATSIQDPTKTGMTVVTVPATVTPTPTVSSVSVTPPTATVQGGDLQVFSAVVSGSNTPSQVVTWAATAGSIDASGLFQAPAATGTEQLVTVTATSFQNTAFSGNSIVTVPAAPPDPDPTPNTAFQVFFSAGSRGGQVLVITWNNGA